MRPDEIVSDNTYPDIHNEVYLVKSELNTVRIFLCPSMATSAIKHSVSRKHAVSVHSPVDGSVAIQYSLASTTARTPADSS